MESPLISLAILEAKKGKQNELRAALRALVSSTRLEPGCLDYTLFEKSDEPGMFYMRETFKNRAALEKHFAMPYFRAFEERLGELLAQPLQLVFLSEVH